jgi:hypothetical protein
MNTRPLLAAALLMLLTACASPPPAPGLTELVQRPAERALLAGWRAYDDAQYDSGERELKSSLALGLQSPRDQAKAHKLLAFIYCTSQRTADGEAAFRAARVADPSFTLSRAEAGHPLWGPVYRRVAAQR